jgi:hypothetical protein
MQIILILGEVLDAYGYIFINISNELGLIFLIQLERDLLEAVDDQTKSVLFGLVLNQ